MLAGTAASIAIVHTLLGPDHYLPFIVLARARGWSAVRTAGLTMVCGAGHVAGSVVLGAAAIHFGLRRTSEEVARQPVEEVRGARGQLARGGGQARARARNRVRNLGGNPSSIR